MIVNTLLQSIRKRDGEIIVKLIEGCGGSRNITDVQITTNTISFQVIWLRFVDWKIIDTAVPWGYDRVDNVFRVIIGDNAKWFVKNFQQQLSNFQFSMKPKT